MKKALNAYKQVGAVSKIEDASPHRLVQMLLETGIESVQKAKAAVLSIQEIQAEKGVVKQVDIMTKIHHINKTFEIVDHLKASLNADASQEISDNLAGLYEYVLRQLININGTNDDKLCDHVADILNELLAAWNAIPAEHHHLTSLGKNAEEVVKAEQEAENKKAAASKPPPEAKSASKGDETSVS